MEISISGQGTFTPPDYVSEMGVYVAGKFEEVAAVRAAQAALQDAGFRITHDWTGESTAGKSPEEVEPFLTVCAENDFVGVVDADAVLVLNHDRAFGAMVEMGIAIARGIPVFVVGYKIRDNIFFHLGSDYGMYLFDTVEEAVTALKEMRSAIDGLTDD